MPEPLLADAAPQRHRSRSPGLPDGTAAVAALGLVVAPKDRERRERRGSFSGAWEGHGSFSGAWQPGQG